MQTTRTALDITVTVSPGMVLAPPASYALRLGVRQTLGTVTLATSMVAFSLFLGGQPWQVGCNAVTTLPFLAASALLAIGADLLLLPRSRNKRLRQSAIMNGSMLALGLSILLSVILNPQLAWPTLFPVLFVAFALPVIGPLNIGVVSRLKLDDSTWRLIVGAMPGWRDRTYGGRLSAVPGSRRVSVARSLASSVFPSTCVVAHVIKSSGRMPVVR